jgi:hypothetical protein
MTKPGQNGNGSHVTLSALNDKLRAFRWEVRFLILAAVVGGKFVPPVSDATHTALRFIAKH